MTNSQVASVKGSDQDDDHREAHHEVSSFDHSYTDQTNDELDVVDVLGHTRDELDEEDEYQSLISRGVDETNTSSSNLIRKNKRQQHNQESQMKSSSFDLNNKNPNGLFNRIKSLINYPQLDHHDNVSTSTSRPNHITNTTDDMSTSDEFVFHPNRASAAAATDDDWWVDRWPAIGEQTNQRTRAREYNNNINGSYNERSLNELSRSPPQQHSKLYPNEKNSNTRNNTILFPVFNEKNHHHHHHHYQRSSSTSIGRSLRALLILFILLICSIIILVKLLNLVRDNRDSSRGIHLIIDQELDESHRRQYELEQSARWLVSTPKCHIPVLEPWHKSIEEYVWSKKPMNCTNVINKYLSEPLENDNKLSMMSKTLTFVRSNKLYFNEEAVNGFGIFHEPSSASASSINHVCCYKNITRSMTNDDDLEYGDVCVPIKRNGINIPHPLIQVYCKPFNYTNVHSFNIHDTDEEVALRKVAASKLNSENYYNILMVGMDTISRLNGQRQLNRTLNVLRNLYETLEFVGYNKVGENTFPNLIPLLTGLKPEQLTQVQCWQPTNNYTEDSDRGDDFLDNCKYLWNYYQQIGYTTYFSEDWPGASTFNYLKPGFKHEPTTYYGRPFTLARKSLLFPKFKTIGCADCHLDQPIVKVDLNNLKLFLEDHQDVPYFAFHWSNCPQHDELNGASQVDAIVEKFFQDIHNITLMDRTFVIFFSDHGYRWNNFVSTRIGHYESSLPMMTIAPPKRFIRQHPELYERLKQHKSALLTPFDMFKTLIDVKNLGLKTTTNINNPILQELSNSIMLTSTTTPNDNKKNKRHAAMDVVKKTTVEPHSVDSPTTSSPTAYTKIEQLTIQDGLSFKQDFRILSLLDQHNSSQLDRSCIEAGIPDNYCVCHQFENVATDAMDVLGAAYYLVYVHLHGRLRDHVDICHLLDLEGVHKAELYNMESIKQSTKSKGSRRKKKATDEYDANSSSSSSTRKPEKKVLIQSQEAHSTTTASPSVVVDPGEVDRHNVLPNREYNIRFSTKPGGALFQEVVRYYGDDMAQCQAEIEKAKKVVDDYWSSFDDKRNSVISMNSVCEFSVHSESISRLNLYGEQSKCVKSNIELKKVCYCKS